MIMSLKKPLYLTVIVILATVFIAWIGIFFWQKQQPSPIHYFNYSRDAQFIKDTFQKDWYWLVSDESDLLPEDVNQLLTHGYIEKRGGRAQRVATIKVLLENNNPAAFVIFYKERSYRGYIQFLAVSPEARGKGYGTTLIKNAIEELFSLGCEYIYLTTRLSNTSARSIYEKAGFKEKYRDQKYIEYTLFKADYKS